ncbi:WD repeat, SAM and U-box domain-containing protein 1 isoform X3 [Numida meleagris]|uniref:WD repeat, SAM and U-box domain-containing protein 1 isoform X3 n=1 Tax=Numida meleagris TaxID=8996 RepID=UPI000B3DC013|nr:WD repeat, SAM and U-box domain-containing protein 1 isoform X3 [Numida meleagris]
MAMLIRTLTDHSDDVNCCAFSSSCLATCSLDKTIRIYSLNDFTELPYSPLKGHTYAVHCCCFSPSGHTLASCSTDGATIIWDTRDGRMLAVLGQPSGSPVRVCRFSPESTYLVSGAADGSVVLWNTQTMKLYRSVDKCVIIYETNTGNILHTLSQHTRYVTTCAFAPHSLLLATGSMDKTVHIWQLDSEQPRAGDTTENDSKMRTAENWSEDDVSAWLCAQGLAELVGLFKANNIDGKELLNLTRESLTNELKIESLGLRSKILQKIEELRMKTVSVAVPDEFLCPITRELMKDPVIAADGYSYEKEAMENWISNERRSSPMTNLPLHSLVLTPNRTLKMAISRWLETQQKCGETTPL